MLPSSPALLDRLRSRMESRKADGESGSLILDILIGMAIFALIAIIAVSAISQYRARAYEQGAMSDAKSLGLALEAAYTDTQTYPATGSLTDQASLDTIVGANTVNLTKNVTVSGFTATGGAMSFCTIHAKGAWATYDSAAGGLTDSGRDDAPAGCTVAESGPGAGVVAGPAIDPTTGCDLRSLSTMNVATQWSLVENTPVRAVEFSIMVSPGCFSQARGEHGLSIDPTSAAAVQAHIASVMDATPPGATASVDPGYAPYPTVFGYVHAASYDWPVLEPVTPGDTPEYHAYSAARSAETDAYNALMDTFRATATQRLIAAGYTVS